MYSVGTANKLRQYTSQFVQFVNRNYPEVRWAKELKAEHVQAYLDSFGDDRSYKTVVIAKSLLIKLGRILNNTYHLDLDFSSVKNNHKHSERLRDHAITTEDFITICSYSLNSHSGFKFIPLVSSVLGTRIEEAVSIKLEEIDLDQGIVHLTNCKNGRDRDVKIAPEYRFIFENIIEYSKNHGYDGIVKTPNPVSANAFIRDVKHRFGLNDKYHHESNHLFRKMYSKRRFIEEQLKGKDIIEAWETVQSEIGHGKRARPELFRAYIGVPYKRYLKEYSERPVSEQSLCNFDNLKNQVDYILSTKEILEDLNRI